MKIFFDARVFEEPYTGVAKTTMLLYRQCLHMDPSLTLTAVHRNKIHAPLPEGISGKKIGSSIPRGLWGNIAFNTVAKSSRPDLFHFPWNGNVPLLFSPIPVITTLHDVLPLTIDDFSDAGRREAYIAKVRADLKRSAIIITVSEFSKKEILKYFHEAPEPLVLYHGPTLEAGGNFPEPKQPPAPYFLYVGGYASRKGLPNLLKVFFHLRQEKKLTSTLLLTGAAHYFSKEFEHLVRSGKKRGFLVEKGYVPDRELIELYQGARALVYPSQYEGFGLPPLEAMTLGCPVITTRSTSIPEVCGDAVWYIDPDNDKSLRNALLAMETNKQLRGELILKGREQAKKFTWEISAQKFLAAIDTLASRRAEAV